MNCNTVFDDQCKIEARSASKGSANPLLARRASIHSCVWLLLIVVPATGCTRAHYRRQADREVNCIIDNKAVTVGEAPGRYRIDVDPRSRMYDGNNPDCPPMPPDDPISHQLMHCVDCKPGAPCWRHSAKTPYVDNPTWQDYLPRDKDGNVALDMTGAVQLALLESPEYQEQLENLYLSGLDVTFERFRFDAQYFGGSSIFYETHGPLHPQNPRGRGLGSSVLEVNPADPTNRWRVEKFTATGGEVVVGFANSLMWQFAGPDNYSSNTLLDFNIIQPLLRAGGRARVMERLTLAERILLANVRQMEHYRRGFYLNVVTGRDAGDGPNRRGGFLGGSGLEGFSGVGVGGFGRVGGIGAGFGGQNAGFTGGAGAQQAGGYIGLLQAAQVIRNQYANIASLGDSLEQLQAAYEAGRIDRFQVDLARQALYNAQSQLLNSEAQYATALDNFKLQHGLPPSLEVKIADPMLDEFNLLDPRLSALQIRVTDVLTVLREGNQDPGAEGGPAQPLALPDLPPPDAELKTEPSDFASLLKQAVELRIASQERFADTQNDLRKLDEALPKRKASLQRLAQREDAKEVELDPELVSPQQLEERVQAINQETMALGQRLAAVWGRIDGLVDNTALPPVEQRTQLTSALSELSGALLELSLLQARARLDAITFEPVDLTPEEAYCIASRYRRDWMNARAAVVDSWRLIAFNANDLQSDLDLVFSGDIGNVGDNPFNLDAKNGRLSVGLQYDAPLTRLAERNVYRQSLIEYQQAKRTYYQFRDRVQRNVRASLRQLSLDDLNFELRRAAVHVAITQVDLARLRLSEPARPVSASAPGQPTQPGGASQFGDTVARDLVNALIDLLNVQNDFLSVWVDHTVQTINLDFELGTMELDYRGVRIEHEQPLKTFLTESPNPPVCELPEPCAPALMKETKAEETNVLPVAPPPGVERTPVEDLPLIAPPDIVPPADNP
jgi:hypothetical protein